jgi:hypothetical protein
MGELGDYTDDSDASSSEGEASFTLFHVQRASEVASVVSRLAVHAVLGFDMEWKPGT